jgi:hypothetical protein
VRLDDYLIFTYGMALPHIMPILLTVCSQFFRLTAEDGCRAALQTKCDALRGKKLKRISKARLFSSSIDLNLISG